MKMNITYRSIGFLLFLIFLIIAFIPYFVVFSGPNISESMSNWGSFGSYISGIIGVINVIVFIYITYLVSKLDDKKNSGQIEAQYKIVINQFRQNELDKLSLKLDAVFDNIGDEEKKLILYKITSACNFLTNFINQKKYLFPIIDDIKIKTFSENILSRYDQLIAITDEIHGNHIESWQEDKLTTKIQFIFSQKSALIDELQQFILNDLRK